MAKKSLSEAVQCYGRTKKSVKGVRSQCDFIMTRDDLRLFYDLAACCRRFLHDAIFIFPTLLLHLNGRNFTTCEVRFDCTIAYNVL